MLDPCANVQLAVVPSLLGPLQSLMLVLPQVLLGLVLAVNALANPMAWREGLARVLGVIRRRPLKSCGHLLLASSLLCLLGWALTPTGSPITALEGPVSQGDWPTFHANPARTGKGDLIEVAPEADLIWKFHDSLILERLPFACSPAVAGGRVLIGGDNYKLYCLSVEDGSPLWTFEAKAAIFSSPAIWNGRVYIGEGLHHDTSCRLYCLDLNTGKELWSFPTTSHTESSPAVHDGKVYFGAGDNGVYCCDALTGEKIWHDSQGHVDCAPLVIEDRVYYGSGYKWQGIICADAQTGREVWKKKLPVPSWGAPSYAKGRLYIALGNGNFNESDAQPFGEVRCLEASTGNQLWRFSNVTDGIHSSVAVHEARAVFGSRDGGCYALDAETGALLWRADIGAPILSSPALAGEYVFLGADDGIFRCLDLNDGGVLWQYDTSGDVLVFGNEDGRIQSSPAIAQGKTIFGAANGNVYCLGGDAPSVPVIAQTRFRSPLMRAADSVTVGLLSFFAGLTGSYGIAILLAALVLKLLLLPLDWKQARQIWRTRKMAPVLEKMRREYTDFFKEWIPGFVESIRTTRQQDLSGFKPQQLLAEFEGRLDHFLNHSAPVLMTGSILSAMKYRELEDLLISRLGRDGIQLTQRLMSGLTSNPALELHEAMCRVARGGDSEDSFLQRFGHRCGGNEFELAVPRWREDPAPLRAQIEQMQETQHVREGAVPQGEAARKQADARLRELSKDWGRVACELMQTRLHMARELYPLRELSKNYLMMEFEGLRAPLVTLDRQLHLAGGIFYLGLGEIRDAIEQAGTASKRIEERRRQHELYQQMNLPHVILGTQLVSSDPFGMAGDGYGLAGLGVSPGIAEGRVRILTSAADLPAVQKGEILVVPSLEPTWTSAFIRAAGLVAQRGATLSHGAIIAREFTLPAVVNVPEATTRLRNGQEIKVNGTSGKIDFLRTRITLS